VLFEAVARLASGPLPDVFLMLLGDGPDDAMLRELAKEMGLEDRIAFFPFTSEPEYGFERIDITVLSSLYKEGLPNVLQESMCMGVPVVSSNMAGVPEIVLEGQTGYMAEPGNSEQLAEGIQNLWADQAAYKQMRLNARRLMEEDFDKETQFDRFLEHFRSCV
jgi:glycosyltransferase involved in cell wall biosynthesis